MKRASAVLAHQFDSVGFQAQRRLHARKDLAHEGDLLRPVHLGLDHVHTERQAGRHAGATPPPAQAQLCPRRQLASGTISQPASTAPLDKLQPAPAAARVGQTVGAADVRDRGHHCRQRIQEPLRDGGAICGGDRVGVHVDTDVAHQQQRATWQSERRGTAVGGAKAQVGTKRTRDGLAALGHRRAQVAAHEPGPIRVASSLVHRVHRGHRVLEVHDGRDGRLQHNILDARWVGPPDRIVRVDPDLAVQVVVAEQHARQLPARRSAAATALLLLPGGGVPPQSIAHELRRLGEPQLGAVRQHAHELLAPTLLHHAVPLHVAEARARHGESRPLQPKALVEEGLRTLEDQRATLGAVRALALPRDHVCAVQGVEQGAPARVRRIEREARVVNGAHQLWPGNGLHAR